MLALGTSLMVINLSKAITWNLENPEIWFHLNEYWKTHNHDRIYKEVLLAFRVNIVTFVYKPYISSIPVLQFFTMMDCVANCNLARVWLNAWIKLATIRQDIKKIFHIHHFFVLIFLLPYKFSFIQSFINLFFTSYSFILFLYSLIHLLFAPAKLYYTKLD